MKIENSGSHTSNISECYPPVEGPRESIFYSWFEIFDGEAILPSCKICEIDLFSTNNATPGVLFTIEPLPEPK